MTTTYDRRLVEERIVQGLMVLCLGIVLTSLLLIIGTILARGLPALSLDMITRTPQGGFYLGKEGGVLNAIVGSLYVALGATGLSLVFSLPIVFCINFYVSRDSRLARATRLSLDILWGIPSIVYGAVGFMIMLALGMRASLGAAIVTVALFELPVMVRAMDEIVQMVPREIEEASLTLGATRLETVWHIITRQTLPGLLTATLMAFGRGIGDTASVLLTAGFTDRLPTSLSQPAATLPLAIFFQLATPYPEVQSRAYACAAILTLMVLAVSLLARCLARRYTRHVVN
jgi:phosphate transport system permease protein